MILYIKGADFSSANIGTLSTFIVRKSLGMGLIHDIPNFVEKNSTNVSWTISLVNGYTFGDYMVTMGSTVITPIVTEGNMIINIPLVSDNINISIQTSYVNTDDTGTTETTGLLLNNIPNFASLNILYGPTQGAGGSSFIEKCNLPAGTYIDYVDFLVMAPDSSFPAQSVTVPDLKLYFVDAETCRVDELVYDKADVVSELSDKVETANYQIVRCFIQKTVTKPTHIGITVNSGYSDYKTLYSIPYVTYDGGGSQLSKPYFGSVISIGNTYTKENAYYCPLAVYGY